MPGVFKRAEKPQPLGPPMWLPRPLVPRIRPPRICYHGPGQYCFYCPCHDCHLFFEKDPPSMRFNADTLEVSRPKYSYMGLVNSLRNASSKREEDRQDKLRAEREASAAEVKAPEKDKALKDQPKNNE